MIQPYLTAVDTAGETAVLCTPDATGELTFSHAIRKGPMLTGPDTGRDLHDYDEDITARDAHRPAELAVAGARAGRRAGRGQAAAVRPGGPDPRPGR